MLVHYNVVSVPERRENAHRITNTLAATLTVDTGREGHIATHRRGWANRPAWADWVVQLEDDALPCPRFDTHAQQILASTHAEVVSFYAGTGYPTQAQPLYQQMMRQGRPLITNQVFHAVSLAIRADLIDDMLDHARDHVKPWDEQVGAWVQDRGYTVEYAMPSHCDHADGPSILPATDWQPRDLPRRAHLMCGS